MKNSYLQMYTRRPFMLKLTLLQTYGAISGIGPFEMVCRWHPFLK